MGAGGLLPTRCSRCCITTSKAAGSWHTSTGDCGHCKIRRKVLSFAPRGVCAMTHAAIIDALFSIPQKGPVTQIANCIPYLEDLAPRMKASGIAGAVLVHGNCMHC